MPNRYDVGRFAGSCDWRHSGCSKYVVPDNFHGLRGSRPCPYLAVSCVDRLDTGSSRGGRAADRSNAMNGALANPAGHPTSPMGGHARRYVARVAMGEMGALPALTGLVLFSGVFALLRPTFLSASNLANLFTQ